MKILKTPIKGLYVIKQENYKDNRGSLREIHNSKIIGKKIFKYEYFRFQKKCFKRFHFQTKFQQVKFVNVLKRKDIRLCNRLEKKI